MPGRLISRRAALAGLAAIPLAACTTGRGAVPAAPRPLGLASLTVSRELAADYPGTLKAVQVMGYTHFGFPLAASSPRHPVPPDPLRVADMVRSAGLSVGVVRAGHSEAPEVQMRLAARVGASIVAQSASPVFFTGAKPGEATRAEFEAWLPRLAELSNAARAEGLRLVYHNHHWDHVPMEGMTPLEIIGQRFAPGEVDFEIDLAWTRLAGVDPLGLVSELGARVLSLHYKDVDAARGPDLHSQLVAPGQGAMGYQTLVRKLDVATEAIGYVEVDEPEDGLLSAAVGARTIRQARGLI